MKTIIKSFLVSIALALMALEVSASAPFTTGEFTFESSGLSLHGVINQPKHVDAKSLIIIIPGSGPTNVVEGNWFYDLRLKFTALGIAVAIWDKPGCGKSQGQCNVEPSIENSADEVVDAIKSFKSNKVPGHESIALWSGSRGSWVAPLAINREPDIKLWISVSGTDAYESWGYMLRSNLALEGYSKEKIETLHHEWIMGNLIFSQGGSYRKYLGATRELRKNAFYQKFTGQEFVDFDESSIEFTRERKNYDEVQKGYILEGHTFDKESGLEIIVKNFDQVLSNIPVSVLALFGDNDKHVDWRKTKTLYEQTIGKNEEASLSIKVFQNADHSIRLSQTGGYFETMQASYWDTPYADGYYQEMLDFLCANKLCAETSMP